jgi:hypothetical protein
MLNVADNVYYLHFVHSKNQTPEPGKRLWLNWGESPIKPARRFVERFSSFMPAAASHQLATISHQVAGQVATDYPRRLNCARWLSVSGL